MTVARNASRKNQWVTLDNRPTETDDADGMYSPLSPAGVWAAIETLSPQDAGRALQSIMTIDYHPQVGLDTRVTFVDLAGAKTRRLMVRGLQNPEYANVELRLLCEEAI